MREGFPALHFSYAVCHSLELSSSLVSIGPPNDCRTDVDGDAETGDDGKANAWTGFTGRGDELPSNWGGPPVSSTFPPLALSPVDGLGVLPGSGVLLRSRRQRGMWSRRRSRRPRSGSGALMVAHAASLRVMLRLLESDRKVLEAQKLTLFSDHVYSVIRFPAGKFLSPRCPAN